MQHPNIMSKESSYNVQSHLLRVSFKKSYPQKLSSNKTIFLTLILYNLSSQKYLLYTVMLIKLYQSVMFNCCLISTRLWMAHQKFSLLRLWNFHIMAYINTFLHKNQTIYKGSFYHFWNNLKLMKLKDIKKLISD